MYRERLVGTVVRSESASRLQKLLLEYHDFRLHKTNHRLLDNTFVIADWQAGRLKATHQDLYQHPGYHEGLEFLLTDLYAPTSMTRRDDNIDRVFPKMVKWLPDQQLAVLAGLVELNLITQQLDLELAELFEERNIPARSVTTEHYCEAYRASQKLEQRKKQVMLAGEGGKNLTL